MAAYMFNIYTQIIIHTDTSGSLGLSYAAAYQHLKRWVCTACPTYTAGLGFTLC